MPVLISLRQCCIILILSLCNCFFNADVLPHNISILIQHQKGQQPAHSAVTIIERMDTEKIQDKTGDQKQGINEFSVQHILISAAKCLHSTRCLVWFQRAEQHMAFPAGKGHIDLIGCSLKMSSIGQIRIFQQITVQLQDVPRLYRNIGIVLVDEI